MALTKSVLIIGEKPELMDYSDPAVPPGMTAEKVMAGLTGGKKALEDLGFEADLCLTDEDESAAGTVTQALRAKSYDCVVIGAGLRVVPRNLILFETLLNVVHEQAPHARIAFNSKPDDSAEAARRWL